MAWSVPRYSKSRVDAAGKLLAKTPSHTFTGLESSDLGESVEIVNNWRSSHTWPLRAIRNTLEKRAKSINSAALVAQRLKRFRSIEKKLCDNLYRHMTLTQIQDIGGCRAVMPTIHDALVDVYKSRAIKSEALSSLRSYVYEPKADGYRSVHLVCRYQSAKENFLVFNGHRVEIQIRSQLQHAWATAVEMLLTFTTIPVRVPPNSIFNSLPREAEEVSGWRRFFKLFSSAIAMREGHPIVPGTPSSEAELIRELRQLSSSLRVAERFWAWKSVRVFMSSLSDPEAISKVQGASQFLLQLDTNTLPPNTFEPFDCIKVLVLA